VRRRLQITYVTLLAAVLLGLDIPLAITLASRDTQTVFIDRQNDTARFASLADPALRGGHTDALLAELRQYDALYGISAAIIGRDGRLVLTSRADLDPADPMLKERIDEALSGQRAGFHSIHWPWLDEPLVVAEPIGQGGDTIGVVLTVSPTAGLQAVTWRNWGLLAALSALVLLAGAAAAAPLARWMLRPIGELDDAARSLADGRFDDRVAAASGPPELRHLSASFNAMAERTANLVARQRSFVSYASHQLRTPLATLQLCVENLGPAVQAGGLEDYRMVAEEIERMASMCDALLTYARAEATADEPEDMDAVAVADARVAIWGQAAARSGVRLLRVGQDATPVRVAVQALDQALDALISNSVKFAGAGSAVVVTVQRAEPGWVDIHVVDNGPGMSDEELGRAAEPFWRRPGDQNVDGSGLGVTIADALVSASGGQLDLLPAHPHGVHARIRLPAARPAPPRPAPSRTGRAGGVARATRAKGVRT
jgi:signal transduction histidine kinase